MTYINLKWQMSKDSTEPFLSISYLHDLKVPLLFFTIKKPKTDCNWMYFFFFREQLNSLLKNYNIFYANQENLHISYGQVSPWKNEIQLIHRKKIP